MTRYFAWQDKLAWMHINDFVANIQKPIWKKCVFLVQAGTIGIEFNDAQVMPVHYTIAMDKDIHKRVLVPADEDNYQTLHPTHLPHRDIPKLMEYLCLTLDFSADDKVVLAVCPIRIPKYPKRFIGAYMDVH